MTLLKRLPLFLLMMGAVSISMLAPAIYALAVGEHADARAFFYAGLVGSSLTTLLALALANRVHNQSPVRQLVALLAGFLFLPVLMAIPFWEALRTTTFLSAYFEMASSFTTTGITLFDPGRLSGPEHLWRAQVGWMGGLVMWVAAASILAPLALGGFEITARGEPGQPVNTGSAMNQKSDPVARLWRTIAALVPVYSGLTAALCIMLLVAGDPPLIAVSHAMSVMATSGISPESVILSSPSGLGGEMILFCFLFFALSRVTFSSDTGVMREGQLLSDPEFRLGVGIICVVPVALMIRHWLAAFDVGQEENILQGLRAFWGALFTALSYLSTTGFVSGDWGTSQSWSGLSTPGLILMGLALLGGGVATTAGGVKLMRVYALGLNANREIERLIHPSSVGRSRIVSRRTRREGAFIAWVFFMLFALTLAALAVCLGAFGVPFEPSLVLTIAVLTNTGPLVTMASSTPIDLIALAPGAKLALSAGMVLGRLELLAIIVMLSPGIWRD